MVKDNAELRISKARIQLLLEQPFFGSLVLYLEMVERKTEEMAVPTMATDGTHLYYCADFVMSLSLEHLKAVLIHEICHIVLSHLARRQGRLPMKWNWAADFAANDLIKHTVDSQGCQCFQLPPGVLINDAWHDQSAEQIYGHLPDSPSTCVGSGQQGTGKDKGKGNIPGPTLDDHGPWDQWDKDQSSTQQEQSWKDRVARATIEARTRGKMPGGWQTVIDNFLEPKLNWKSILTDVIISNSKSDYRMYPPKKRDLWRGIYLPSMQGEAISMMFGVDVSGSISDEEIVDALSEVVGIASQFSDFTIFLRCFDTRITGRWGLRPFDEIPRVICGRGGTNFQEILDEAEKTPGISTLVIMSDLEASFPPEPRGISVIWLSVSEKKAPFGLTILYPRKEK